MARQICRRCNRLLEHEDLVRATVVARFVGLKSEVIYALDKPVSCESLEHLSCQFPKGDVPDDDN